MELADLPEDINTLQYKPPGFLPKTLEDINGNDNKFISVVRLNTCYTYYNRLFICWQILGQQPVGEFAKRHIYEQYQSKRAVSQKCRLFFLILIMQAMLREDEGKLQG